MVEPASVPKQRSWFRRALGLGLALLLVPLVAPASLLVLVAETRPGRLFGGIACLILMALTSTLVLSRTEVPASRSYWIAARLVAVAAAAVLVIVLIRTSPEPPPERSTGLISRFLGDRRVPAYSPFRLLPEIDQVKLGVTLATRFVPWVSRARTIREITMGHYRAIEADPAARGLEPVTHFAVLEMLGADFDSGHYFAYIPRARPGESLGAIVFLHGNGGNFQVMPWAWRSFAERYRFVILGPTHGFGFWSRGGVEAVDRVWQDARTRCSIDPDRVYLAGLSDGGVGVTQSGLAHPDRYRGLIYLSPTMHQEELGNPDFVRAWKGRPVLVFQGDRDWSVSKTTVDPAVDLLGSKGVDVDYRILPGEDHFLFFSRSNELFDAIGQWMARAELVPFPFEKAGREP